MVNNYQFYINQGKLHSQEGKWDQVITNYQKALELNPNLPFDIYQKLGEAIKIQGRREQKKIETKYLLEKGTQFKKQGKIKEAILEYNKAISKNPYDPYSYILLGDSLQENKESEQAEMYYRLAIYLLANTFRQKSLEEIIAKVNNKENIIITQVANNYFPMFELWYSYFKKLNIGGLMVIALDHIIYQKLIDLGINTYLLPLFNYDKNYNLRHDLWFETVKFRKRIIDMDINYLHTDIDAFWLKNPLDFIESRTEDLISSIAFGTPSHIIKHWNFAACFGFYKMKSNEKTKRIYQDYISYTKLLEHDQNAMNQLLFENEISWHNLDELSHKGAKKGHCKTLDLDVYIISNELITRRPERLLNKDLPSPYVFHPCLTQSSMKEKIEQLNKWGIS